MMVFRYWLPRLRWQLIAYPAASLVCSILAVLLYRCFDLEVSASLVPMGLMNYMVLFGALPFATAAGRSLSMSIPARNSEKATFALLYTLVALPLLVYVPGEIIFRIFTDESAFMEKIAPVMMHLTGVGMAIMTVYSIAGTLGGAVTGLFVTVKARTHRIIKTLGFAYLVPTAPGFVVGLVAGIVGVRKGLEAARTGAMPDQNALTADIFQTIMPAITVLAAIMVVYLAVMIWLTCRAYRTRQV